MNDNNHAAAPEENSVTVEPTVETNYGGGERFEAAVPASVSQSNGILGTARRADGGALRADPTGDDLVTVKGVSMRISEAERLGFLTRDANGRYIDVSEDQLKNAEKAVTPGEIEAEPDLSEALTFTPEGAEALTNLFSAAASHGIPPMSIITEFAKNPHELPKSVQALAEASGIDLVTATRHFAAIVREVDTALHLYVMEKGVSPERLQDFYAYWRKVHSPAKRAFAIGQALFQGDARPIADVVEQFIRAEGSGRAAKAETEIRKVGTRKVETVTVNGITTSLENARRLGLV